MTDIRSAKKVEMPGNREDARPLAARPAGQARAAPRSAEAESRFFSIN